MKKKCKICIVGAGWYGCHLGYKLSKSGHNVSIFEKTLIYFKGLQDLTNLDYIQVIIILDQRTRSMKLNKTLKNF